MIVINEGKTVEQLTKGQNKIQFLVTTLFPFLKSFGGQLKIMEGKF